MSIICTRIGFVSDNDNECRAFPPANSQKARPVQGHDEHEEPTPNEVEWKSGTRMQSLVEHALRALAYGATPLFGFANATGRLDRQRFLSALLAAAGLILTAYAMDWFLFGTVRFTDPDFFPIVAGAALAVRLPILGVRRLRDTGRSGWLTLALLVPVVGWLLLARWWCAPSVIDAAIAPSERMTDEPGIDASGMSYTKPAIQAA